MSYEDTLKAVRALSEDACRRPAPRQAAIAPYRPPVVPAAAVPAPPPARVVQLDEHRPAPIRQERANGDLNRENFERSRLSGRAFTHRVSGREAFRAGEDRQLTILDTLARRLFLTATELHLWWKELVPTETDHAA